MYLIHIVTIKAHFLQSCHTYFKHYKFLHTHHWIKTRQGDRMGERSTRLVCRLTKGFVTLGYIFYHSDSNNPDYESWIPLLPRTVGGCALYFKRNRPDFQTVLKELCSGSLVYFLWIDFWASASSFLSITIFSSSSISHQIVPFQGILADVEVIITGSLNTLKSSMQRK